ncbi:MAG: isochorismatase family protein [Pseudomonadota bacterium]
MLLDRDDSQLVLVDYQQRLMPAIHEGERVIANAARLARIAGLLRVPVWATEQNPQGLGPLVPELAELAALALPKMSFSAATVLEPKLRPPARSGGGNARSLPKHLQKATPAAAEPGRATLVLAGCETHVCLLQTALDLLDAEWDVWVVTDASSSRTERNRDAAFDRLASAGAELVTTEMVAFEWMRTAEHPRFKDVLELVK